LVKKHLQEADMNPFFSPRYHPKEQIAGRALITAAALLFLLTALFHALPSRDRLAGIWEDAGLSGYSRVEETATELSPALEEFYDRPLTSDDSDATGIPDLPIPQPSART
jgi:hypothetical protein